jgi:hypothetical protein
MPAGLYCVLECLSFTFTAHVSQSNTQFNDTIYSDPSMTLQPGLTVLGNRKNYLWWLLIEEIANLEASILRRTLAD